MFCCAGANLIILPKYWSSLRIPHIGSLCAWTEVPRYAGLHCSVGSEAKSPVFWTVKIFSLLDEGVSHFVDRLDSFCTTYQKGVL